MKWTVERDEERKFLKIVTEGLFTVEDHRQMIIEITSSQIWKPGMNVLFDNRHLDFSGTDIAVIREAANNHIRLDASVGGGRIAVLMKTTTDFARGRQYEILTDNKISARIFIFTDETKALEWLGEKRLFADSFSRPNKS